MAGLGIHKKFFITGACGQIGKQLIPFIYNRYGPQSVVVSDLKVSEFPVPEQPQFVQIDVTVFPK